MKTEIEKKIIKNLPSIGSIAGIIVFWAIFLVLLNSYICAEDQYYKSITLDEVPANAIYANMGGQPTYWGNNTKTVFVPDTSFFKLEKMDNLSFSIGHENEFTCSERAVLTLLVRGVKYINLPFVYEYKGEVNLRSGDLRYKFNKFSISETAPWILTIEYKKESLLTAVLLNFIIALGAGIVLGIGTVYVLLIILYLAIVKKIKKTI